jgi:ATP-dependent DNA helicase RecG
MPSALEKLVKILKLEREQGYKNTAVIGGLGAYTSNWGNEARSQAKWPELLPLIDELTGLMQSYDTLPGRNERHQAVGHMLDRIMTGLQPRRAPAAPSGENAPAEEGQPTNTDGGPPRERRNRQEHPPRGERPPRQEGAQAEGQPQERPPRSERGERPPRQEGGQREGQPRNERGPRQDAAQGEGQSQERRERPPRPEAQGDVQPRAERGPRPETAQAEGQDARSERRNKDKDKKSPQRDQQPKGGGNNNQRQPPRHDAPPRQEFSDGSADDMFALEGEVSRARGPVILDLPPRPRLARPPRRTRPPMDAAQMAELESELNQPVQTLKGVGPAAAEKLSKLGIYSIRDLLFYLPRRYDDYTLMLPIRRLQPNMRASVVATIKQAEVRIGKNNRKDFYLLLDDGSGVMSVTFFGQGAWLGQKLRVGMQICVRGATEVYRDRLQMSSPDWERVEPGSLQKATIVPIYPLSEDLKASDITRPMEAALAAWADRMPEYVPESVLERADLPDMAFTIRNLHAPESMDHLAHAKRRLIFDQLLVLQLAVLGQRRAWQSIPGVPLSVSDEWLNEFLSAVFPYPLTGAQQRVVADIRADISRDVAMNRLIQGDVGSGKTAVALTALAMALANGKQAAIMAPTSILAEQHYRNFERLLANMPGERRPVIALLTSKLTTTERESVYRGIADGSIDLVVGTHAVIQEGVEFNDLAVAVIDEQHRFGVEQRGALRGKGSNPHLLVMTATPIPRTLALTLFADLDLSIIDEMPPGRIPIQTRVIEPHGRERAYNFVEGQLEKGRQAFMVYPLVESTGKIDAQAAIDAYDHLQRVFYDYRVGLLHGRMKPAEKDEVMQAFADKTFDVLVTTSVAEVGVDVPNASVIVIDGANRFGLAQLHQFRGRVGRGGHASYCLLVCDSTVTDARERLTALEMTTDGFKLAEIDWQLRGPGDLVGTRQSGGGLLQLVEDMKPELVELAQREAKTLYEEDPELLRDENMLLRRRVLAAQDERSDHS